MKRLFKYLCINLASFFSFLLVVFSAGAQTLVVPPSPGDLSSVEHLFRSDDFTVEVKKTGDQEYTPCFVYKSDNYWVDTYHKSKPKDPKAASFTNFSFSGTSVDVRITTRFPANTVTIRPLNFDVKHIRKGNVVTFTLNSPKKISIEVNDRLNPLFLFADTPEEPNNKATYYFGPGVHNIGRNKVINSNESVYLAGGAVVEGSLKLADGSENISIKGRGILTMGEWPHTSMSVAFLSENSAISSGGTHHLQLDGIMVTNSTGWTIPIYNKNNMSHDNQFRNLKLVCWNGNSDGIWFDGDNNIVDDCFIFNNDDIVTTHGSNNCKISNIVAWGGPWGRLFMHTDWASSSNLTFENINLIGKDGGPELIQIGGARGKNFILDNFVFRNIRVESHPNTSSYHTNKFLIMKMGKNKVSNWLFENITLDDKNPDEGDINGTVEGTIEGITFKNLKMAGKVVKSLEDANMDKNEHAKNIVFIP